MDQSAISRWRNSVRRILKRNDELREFDDQQLRKESHALRYRVLSGEPLDSVLVEAFALVREAARRTIAMSHYEVQLLGGLAIHHGSIAVMQTGEGKTLTATLPMYVAALQGHGAHLATANDYLAERDAELMQPVYNALGMTVGIVTTDTPRSGRIEAYDSDITYSTAREFGFDFLRDRIFKRGSHSDGANLIGAMVNESAGGQQQRPVQRDLNFILIDEADSILIDEARTPLIVSSPPDESERARVELYKWSYSIATKFESGVHYELDEKTKQVQLNRTGRQLVRTLPSPELLTRTPALEIYEQVEQAIFVELNYVRDRQYVIRDGEIVIVDEFTGRLAEGRKWRAGIHQSIEAREGLDVSCESGQAARVTIQDLFLRYRRLSGMTGTVANSDPELRKIYATKVVRIPTNKPPKRIQWADSVHATDEQRWHAVVDEIAKVHTSGRPVLIGTRSIDKSETLSGLLDARGIAHDVLNARHLAREAEIVEQAGEAGKVTVATNMAGRGTDIKISPKSHELGGLHVICTELHESARIDRQLIGRCGRQGDPGTYRQFMSFEDEILETGLGEEKAESLKKKFAGRSSGALAGFSRIFRAAQKTIESKHFHGRKMLLYREKQRQELQREMGQDPYLDTAGA